MLSGNSSDDDTTAETCPQDHSVSQSDESSDAAMLHSHLAVARKDDTSDDKSLVVSDPQPADRRSEKSGQQQDDAISLPSPGRILLRMMMMMGPVLSVAASSSYPNRRVPHRSCVRDRGVTMKWVKMTLSSP
jgi:hypothetical protein